METPTPESPALICGAGPAGLTAAWELTRLGIPLLVLEADPTYVGGIARTVEYKGYRFDIGGHRFFSKVPEIEALWAEWLGSDLLDRDRLSRIYYNGRFYHYPIRPVNAFRNLGLTEATLCAFSYAHARLHPVRDPKTFEDWVTNQFGARLFMTFFKTYTEKVWGISTAELSADWAAQRIRGLSVSSLLTHMIQSTSRHTSARVPKTLIEHFRYPRHGPGQCWETVASHISHEGSSILMGTRLVSLERRSDGAINAVAIGPTGEPLRQRAASVVSSLPLRDLVHMLSPTPPQSVVAAADGLHYRDFLTVGLILDRQQLFADNWLYIHDPTVLVGRIQNFGNWSPGMSADPSRTHLGLEYFCFEDDGLWVRSDAALLELATHELDVLDLCRPSDVVDGLVIRQPKAYPVYDEHYRQNVAHIRDWIAQEWPNLYCVGRNGMHKYNNQDHSMMTALIAARRIAGLTTQDPWLVNGDAEYHEEVTGPSTGGRLVPVKVGMAP